MDNQTRNHLNLQKHIADQDHIIRVRNAEIAALRKRAEKAEKERDEALAGVRVLARENIECHERTAASCGHPNHGNHDHDCTPFLPPAEPRPLTPDAITDEMVLRFWNAFNGLNDGLEDMTLMSIDEVRTGLSAALTEPPTRPEWADDAEEIEAILREEWTFSEEDGGDDAFLNLAERLAERGVRVVGEERS